MDLEAVLAELRRLAEAAGLEVRVETFAAQRSAAGGLCTLKGRQVVLLNEGAPVTDRVAALAEAVVRAGKDLEASEPAERYLRAARARQRGRVARRRQPVVESDATRALRTGRRLKGIVPARRPRAR